MIGLVSCSSQKLDRAAPARELYTSQLFRKSLAYAERHCVRTYVLSALHGLVALNDVIRPYDCTVRTMTPMQRKLWAAAAVRGLDKERALGEPLCILAGEDYVAPIVREIRERHNQLATIVEPLRGMQIGQRLAFLAAEARSAARAA